MQVNVYRLKLVFSKTKQKLFLLTRWNSDFCDIINCTIIHDSCGFFNYRTIRDHETFCKYRLYRCLAYNCQTICYYPEILPHNNDSQDNNHILTFPTSVFKSSTTQNIIWYMMTNNELFIGRFSLHQTSMKWSLRLTASFYRARQLKVELELGGRTYLLNIINNSGPNYILILHYDSILCLCNFEYTLKVSENKC